MILKSTELLVNPFTGPLAPSFEDPIGVLKACHRRIEQRLQMLERVCEILQGNDRAKKREAVQALGPVVAYFTSGGVKHTEDEEESLFPRMRRRLPGGDGAVAVLKSLEAQHREGESFVRELIFVVTALAQETMGFRLTDVERLESVTVGMGTHYRLHIKVEDEIVFPRALKVLKDSELAQVGEEMTQRRGVKIEK